MRKRIVINAEPHETRVALLEDKDLVELLVERGDHTRHVGDIYKGRINAVLPGPVLLPPDLPAHEKQAAIDATLVKREGSPEHVVKAVLHFIDNDFVTGACLPVDGGRTVFAGGS